MPRRRSEHVERVGEWLALLRAHRGWTQRELAELVGAASDRTISNVETGATELAAASRPAWEEAYGLAAGTLTDAYRRGRIPSRAAPGQPSSETTVILDAASVPDRYRAHPSVLEVLTSVELAHQDKIQLLRIWVTQQTAFEQTFDTLRGRAAE
jgi:transcriptional regulator with XRE-family HTH domain